MAAPKIRASLRKSNLSTLSLQEKTPKVTRKNILCPGSQEWPRVAKDVEDSILMKLAEKLTSGVNIVKHINKSSVDDKSEKARIRSQLEIGTSGVFRSLERGELACVLISGQATPAITVDHIISLAQVQGCPLLCLDQLAPALAKATKSKCLPLAVGFKKIDNSHSEFAEVISLVKSNTMTRSPQKQVNLCTDTFVPGMDSVQLGRTNKYRPVLISSDAGKEILGHLKKTFSHGLTDKTDKEKNTTKKKRQKKKKNLKDSFEKAYHLQFDIGKRTVTSFLERGKYEMVLVSEEITPVLLAETQSFSLLSVAAEKKCPVVVLPGLVDAMRALCGGSVSVLGLKKLSSFQDDEKHFKQVIDACLQAVTNMNQQRLSPAERQEFTGQSLSPVKLEATRTPHGSCLAEGVLTISRDTGTTEEVLTISMDTGKTKEVLAISMDTGKTEEVLAISMDTGKTEEVLAISMDTGTADVQISQDVEDTSDKKRLHDKDSAETSTNNAVSDEDEEPEDYSYLYVLKTESKELADVKDELKALTAGAGNDPFSADYISLSARSEPGFQGTSSSRKQKGHFPTKQKAEPTLVCVTSGRPKTVVSDSGTVSKDTECSEQQKDKYIPLTEIGTSNSQSFIHSQHVQVDTARMTTVPLGAPLFSICRSGNALSQSNTAEATQQKQQHNEDKLTASNKEDETKKVTVLSRGQRETPLFSLCRSGNPVRITQEATSKASQQRRQNNDSQLANNKDDKATLGVQELRASADTKYKGIDFLSLVEPGKDAKKAMKRKIQSEKSYISFAYTESNIQTMVSNPSKKKKKKKKKQKN